MVPPQVPRGRPIGQSVLDHQPHGQIHHRSGVLSPSSRQILGVRGEVNPARDAVVLRVRQMDVFGASLRSAQVVQRPLDHPISRSRVAALGARSAPIIPRPPFDPWLRQVLDPLNPLRGIRDVLSGSRHVIPLSLCLVYRRPSLIPEGKSRQNRYSLTNSEIIQVT
jgi:hypothetical protein